MPTHKPTITANSASCACRRWIVAQRRDNETQGEFTKRVYQAFESHVHYIAGFQPDMPLFEAEPPARPDGAQTELF